MGPGLGYSSREAKEVLVLLAVGMKEQWEVLISFHITRGANADQKKVLIMEGCNYKRDIYYFKYRDREMYLQLDAHTC